MTLQDKTVLVVGGGSGIGKAVAVAAAEKGARIIIASRNSEKLAKAASDIGHDAAFAAIDMTEEAVVKDWARAQPDVDHLVISASSAVHGAFADVETASVRAMFEAKFFGPYVTARELLPKLGDGGSITFFSGVLARRPGINCSGLGAVNGAIESLTYGLALELGPRIRVNCCSPGMVRSDAYANLSKDAREEMYRSTGASLPIGRVGRPEEIAEAVLFLATNSYMTGQVVDIDGGHMIRQYATR